LGSSGSLDLLVSIPVERSEWGLVLIEDLSGNLRLALPPLLVALGFVALGGEDLAL
jgi:ABC-type Fe3+ transport system permease subunit